MSDHYIRKEDAPLLPPPSSVAGPVHWIRENLFSGWFNSIMTLLAIYVLVVTVPGLVEYLFINAVWDSVDGKACRPAAGGGPNPADWSGACWSFAKAKFGFFMYGFYPDALRWRVDLTGVIGAVGLVLLLIETIPHKRWTAVFMLFVYPVIAYILLSGGMFNLEYVETNRWGGILVTLVVAITGIVVSLPLGILLALGRRSKMPAMRFASVLFIEIWRGVPLITVLFMASVMLPLFLPEGVHFDKLLRCLIGVALFSTAYMAEVVRGGLQAIVRGQYEGAQALGLSYWKTMGLIILPQALKLVIPGIVNTFIGLFKDTTLVLIVGILDLLGTVQTGLTDAKWFSPNTATSAYIFTAAIFWAFCFAMSRYSIYMENKLHTGHKR